VLIFKKVLTKPYVLNNNALDVVTSFNPRPGTHSITKWMGVMGCLDTSDKRKVSWPGRECNHDFSVQPVA